MLAVLEKAGYQAVAPGPNETRFGGIETRAEAALCADLAMALLPWNWRTVVAGRPEVKDGRHRL